MTMSPNSVSSQYLANSLIAPVTQAQAQLTTAMTEELTGQYADLGLQLGEQSGYELSLREQVQELQALTSGNSLVSTSLSTAQDALVGDQLERPIDSQRPRGLDAERQCRRFAADDGPGGAAGAYRLRQRYLGRRIRVRRDQFLGRADSRLLFDARLRPRRPQSIRRSKPPSACCRAIRPRRALRRHRCRASSAGHSPRCSRAPPGARIGLRPRARTRAPKSLRAKRPRPRPTPTVPASSSSPRPTPCSASSAAPSSAPRRSRQSPPLPRR